MARRHHYKRRTKDAHELDVTTFLNLMVVLVPFLLITAVFSRLTIVELNLPSCIRSGQRLTTDSFRVEVIVREDRHRYHEWHGDHWIDSQKRRRIRHGHVVGFHGFAEAASIPSMRLRPC